MRRQKSVGNRQPTLILYLTGDHEIPEIRELVNDNERHLQA